MSAPNVTMVGWVDPPQQRGTYNIITSCLAVLFLCSYKCFHMNVPSPKERQAGWHKVKINKNLHVPYWPEGALWRKLIRKSKWVLLIIVAPELGVGLAASQRAEAQLQLKEALEAAPGWESWLTMSHAFYATMGGIVGENGDPVELVEYVRRLQQADFKPDDGEGERPSYFVSEADIANLSKSDTLTKMLAVGQSLYLVVQCIARRRVGLAYSLLELSTALYTVCATTMYWLWREKPYDAQHVTVFNKITLAHPRKRIKNISEDLLNIIIYPEERMVFPALLQYATATLFGGLHLLAWNWTFPDAKSSLCLWLWRGSSLGMVGLPFTIPVFMAVGAALGGPDTAWRYIISPLLIASLSLYMMCRLTIIGLVVYSLSHMPSGVYHIVPWTAYFPFIS
ncbi:hypothetical protein MAPG_06297 [Magnaporthiopsis poae ATCC 64411]|uniref:Uncharacterized protein n=1 Tax=Magnaporthiopsis poae (strain ATCC 64411 / 73-15) TaxID=644358 RepID=A0A0C4E1N2_MAGP6|nr:hypothetical protein MAPG_06297 [Magnaporthiopsis poae ATCC 64411]